MKNISLEVKIFASFLLMLLLTAVLGIISVSDINNIANDFDDYIKYDVEPLEIVMKTEVAYANARQTSRGFIIRIVSDRSQTESEIARLKGRLDSVSLFADTLVQTFKLLHEQNHMMDKSFEIASDIQHKFKSEFEPKITHMMSLATTANFDEIVELLNSTNDVSNVINNNIQDLYTLSMQNLKGNANKNEEKAKHFSFQIISITVIAVLLGLIFAIVVTKIFSNQIHWYESILNGISESPLSITDKDKKVVFLNHAALDLLGKPLDKCVDKHCGDVWCVDICKDNRCGIEYLKAGKGKSVFNVGDATFTTKANYLTDKKGELIGHVEVVTNITDEVKSQEAMLEEKFYSQAVLDCMTDTIVATLDLDKNLIFMNRPGLEFLGKTLEEIVGKKCYDVFNVSICNTDKCAIEYLKAGKRDTTFAVGDEICKAYAERLIDRKGNHIGYLDIVQNISSQHYKSTYISKGVEKLSNNINQMSTGDFRQLDFTMNEPNKYQQEEYDNLRKITDNLHDFTDNFSDLISQLQDAIHSTASASAEISATADTLAAATHEQSSQTDEVATAMEEMSRTVTDNAHNAVQTANVAKQSGDVATSGGKVVEQTISKMKEIADVVKISAANIAKLGESSKKIGEITSVIDDIADQTNLLSLNAAIEAARAGEQGRGFAVVADSVGKLAISTASATKEIADMIRGIQEETAAAVKAMEKGTTEVQSGIELADNAGNSIQDILSGINSLLDMVNQIAAASEQQSATSEQISKNVSSISKVTADSARNVEDVASTANELARMTETLNSLVSQFKIAQAGHHNHSLNNGNESRLLN